MNKMWAILDLFRKGNSLLESRKWKERQVTATVLGGVILAVVNTIAAFGYSLPVDIETANAIAAGILAIVNTILTITTTDKIGIASESKSNEEYNTNTGIM